MKNLKAYQRSQLIYEFGILIEPLERLVRSDKIPTVSDCRIAIASVQAGDAPWRKRVKDFVTFAEDVIFNNEFQATSHVIERCCRGVSGLLEESFPKDEPEKFKARLTEQVDTARVNFFQYIDRIPVDWEPIVFQANTSFTAYLRIKEAISCAKNRLNYFDRYIKPEFFDLFLAEVDRTVSVRLVTTVETERYGLTAVSAIAGVAKKEFLDFNVIEVTPKDIHDRNLRIDDQVFSLGPGVDRAGLALTNFGPSDSSAEALREFDAIIANGRPVF